MAYVAEIHAESLLVGDEILKLASSDLNPPYSYGLYDPGTALIQSLSLDKVEMPYQEGRRRCGRVRVLSAETAAGLWGVNEVAAAKTRFKEWLRSPDSKEKTPKNRHCALLQLCQNYAKERLNVLASIVAGVPANYGDSASDKTSARYIANSVKDGLDHAAKSIERLPGYREPQSPESPNKKGKSKKAKNKSTQAKQTRSKYEAPVSQYITDMVKLMLEGELEQEWLENLTAKSVAAVLQTSENFANAKIESITQKVQRSEAWKNRKALLKRAYDTGTFRNRQTSNSPHQDVQ